MLTRLEQEKILREAIKMSGVHRQLATKAQKQEISPREMRKAVQRSKDKLADLLKEVG